MTYYEETIRVRYSETDAMGVVYHANYLVWMEIGRTEYLRALGFPYSEMESKDILVPVINVDINYLKPAVYDDEVIVTTKLESFGRSKCEFSYSMRRKSDDAIIVKATSKHAFTDRNIKPVNIKKVLPELWDEIKENF